MEVADVDLASLTLHRAKELGGKPALIDGLAAGLAGRGFARGDTFAI
jgi:hypothetical protein